jgi:CheY-specific phosphatase CheX
MFALYFSRYLLENKLVKQTDIDDIADLSCRTSFLGKLAEKNCLAGDEAERCLSAFKKEHGLTDGCIEAISSGDMEKIVPVFIYFDTEEAIERDITAFQKDTGLTDAEMEARKQDKGIGWFVPDYVQADAALYNNFVQMAMKHVASLVSAKVVLKKARQTREYAFAHLVCQELKGTHRVLLGIAGKEENLLAVAGMLAGKDLPEMDKAAHERISEFINRINGLCASALSTGEVFMKLALPYWYSHKTLTANSEMYCLPVVIGDVEIDFIFSFDNEVDIQ